MSVNIWDGEKLVPIASGGGNQEAANKLAELETLIEQTRQLRADLETYGMVKLSNASNITDSTGLALPVTEKNPDIDGTLANELIKRTNVTMKQSFAQTRATEDEEIIQVSVEVPEDGIYAILAFVSACGADKLTKESPFFECRLINNQSVVEIFTRPSFNINISKIWDNGNMVTIFNFLKEGTLNAVFTSHTGEKLDVNYPSNFALQIIRI